MSFNSTGFPLQVILGFMGKIKVFSDTDLVREYLDGSSLEMISSKYCIGRNRLSDLVRTSGFSVRSNGDSQVFRYRRKSCCLSDVQIQLCLGSLLGDGCLSEQNYLGRSSGNSLVTYRISFYHAVKYYSYLCFKRKVLPGCRVSSRISGMGDLDEGLLFL